VKKTHHIASWFNETPELVCLSQVVTFCEEKDLTSTIIDIANCIIKCDPIKFYSQFYTFNEAKSFQIGGPFM